LKELQKTAIISFMTSGKKVFIVIPAYNEEMNIGSVIEGLKNAGYHNILVVNDGSADKTRERSLEVGAEVIDHIINRGQGAALRTGIEYLRENHNPDIIITFDADGQHSYEDIPKLILPIIEEDIDITLGSRFLTNKNDANIPFLRKLVLKAGVLFTNIISNVKLTDTHNGLRALGKRAVEKIEIYHRGMEHASDIIDEISKKRLRYKEVPVQIAYSEYSKRKGQKTSGFIKMGVKILIKKSTK
jgi:polyprenyl-phospho-N-acetylgalactosaminyl synthase